ncbi:hypothetical protein MIND_00293300 [Mycena indigotica]|uniref:Transmembrane protein n=1 Tax=Mycena indigotica TaxID=2126181 RepID=A0A8H6SZM3_9AGAR|nr:uncharacterized protein MIND_00293300 [Mycena indigotica]KAF7309230.1 hypothetical protein MIND_00293300 [Mycena indigotica]
MRASFSRVLCLCVFNLSFLCCLVRSLPIKEDLKPGMPSEAAIFSHPSHHDDDRRPHVPTARYATITLVLICIAGAAALLSLFGCLRSYLRTAPYDAEKAHADLERVRQEVAVAERDQLLGINNRPGRVSMPLPPPPYLRPPSYAENDPHVPETRVAGPLLGTITESSLARYEEVPMPPPIHARSPSAESQASADSDAEAPERQRLLTHS